MNIFQHIMFWYWRRKILKDARYRQSLIYRMIDSFGDRVVAHIKYSDELNEQTDVTPSTFDQMLDEVRAVVKKHNDALSAISGNRELSLKEDLKKSWGQS